MKDCDLRELYNSNSFMHIDMLPIATRFLLSFTKTIVFNVHFQVFKEIGRVIYKLRDCNFAVYLYGEGSTYSSPYKGVVET